MATTLAVAALSGGADGATEVVGCTTSWAAPVNGLWTDAGKWTNGVPNATDPLRSLACITVDGTYEVGLAGFQSAAGLTLGGSSGTQTLRLLGPYPTGAQLKLTDQGTASAGVLPHGVLVLDSVDPDGGSDVWIPGGTLVNAGTMVVAPGVGHPNTGAGRYIEGNFTNTGHLQLDQSLVAQSAAPSEPHRWETSGTVTIAANRLLAFFTGGAGSANEFVQSGGTIQNDGTFEQRGGVFTSSAGAFNGNPPELHYVTLETGTGSGTFALHQFGNVLASDVGSGYTVRVVGGLEGEASLIVDAARTNNGAIVLTSDLAGRGAQLTVGGSLANAGTVHADAIAGAPAVDVAGTLTNSGGIDLDAGTGLVVESTGTLRQSPTGTITGAGPMTVDGVLSGTGTIAPAVTNAGIVSPGSSPGVLDLSGGYTQSPLGTLRIEIEGAGPGSGYDRLKVGGSARLAGTLELSSTSYRPPAGRTFKIVKASTRSGTFGSVSQSGSARYLVAYPPDGVTALALPPTP